MKTRTIITISALLMALTSCGSAAQYARDASGQKYRDGIYYEPETTMETVASETSQEVDALIAKTKNSSIYMKSGEKVDTLFIPDNKITRIDLDKNTNTTTVTLYDSYPYDSWYMGAWRAYRPWYYSSFYWGPIPGITGDGILLFLGRLVRPLVLRPFLGLVRPLVLRPLLEMGRMV